MFNPVPGGSSMLIGEEDLAVLVHLPPVGKVVNASGVVEDCEIITRSPKKDEQYWERPEPPADWAKKRKKEKRMQESDPGFVDDELQDYRAREWHRRLNGVWVMINGNPLFFTGLYYYYLTHWRIDIGHPEFRLADLHKMYFLDYCVKDPDCYGMLDLAKRRSGKTFQGTAFLTEFSSRTSNAHSGIQSKTGGDAKVVFSEKLIQPFRKLPDFFKPTYDTTQGNVPKRELRFFQPSIKGKQAEAEDYDDVEELESWVDFMPATETAYDPQKMLRYLCDEIFKTVEINILKRHDVVKPCLEDTSGAISGKALYTSTVEEIEGHIDRYIKFWENSDFKKKNKNGRTVSGLYRYFTPAQNVMFLDKFGYPDVDRALEHIQNEIDGKKDPRDKSDYIRKNARNWKEAFNTSGTDCLYDPMKINDRELILNFRDNNFERCKLDWDEDGNVVKRKSPNGNYMFSWDFEDISQTNNVKERAGEYHPLNNLKFTIGIDPFDHNRNQDGTFSDGAAAVFRKYDSLDEDKSDNFVCLYIGRPPTAKMFFEEMVKLCHYFGCAMLHENNKPTIEDYFKENRHGAFMIRDARGNPGIATGEKTIIQIVEETEVFIDTRCQVVDFPQLLSDWKGFDMNNTTKFDIGMASGIALIAASRIRRKLKKVSKFSKKSDVTHFFRKHKLPKAKKQYTWPSSLQKK